MSSLAHDATATNRSAAFFRQSGWLMVANIGAGMLMWGVHFLSKSIPQSEYAVFVFFLAIAMMIPTLPLQMVMAHQAAKALATGRDAELSGMIRRMIYGIAGLWVAAALVTLIFRHEIVERMQIANPAGLYITLLVVLLSLALPIFWGLLQGCQDFLWLGWSMMVSGIGRIGIAAAAVLVFGGWAAGMMVGVLGGLLIAAGIAVWRTSPLWLVQPRPFDWGQLLRQVVPLMTGFAMFQFMFIADTLYAKAYFDGDTVAAYGAAGTLARALMWLVGPLATVMFPRIVHSSAKSEKTNLMSLVLAGTAALALTGAGFLWLLGPWVVRFVYKSSYVGVAIEVLPYYALAMVPLALANVLLNNLLARGAFKIVPWLVLLVIGYTLALTQFHGTLTAILKTLAAFNFLLFLLGGWFTWRERAPA